MLRREALQRLLDCPDNLEEIAAILRAFPWDSSNDLVRLSRANLLSVLSRFLSGELPAEALERWAELLECREDVGFEPGSEVKLRQAIHALANPNLEGPAEAIVPKLVRMLQES